MGRRNKRDIYRREAIKLVDCFSRAASTQYPKHLRDGMREVAQKLREEFNLPSHDNIPSSRQRQCAQVEAAPRLRGSQRMAMAHQQH